MKLHLPLLAFLVVSASTRLQAAPLTWDNDSVTSGAQDGTGAWTLGGTTFWDGSGNVASTNDLTTDLVTFGSGGIGGTVTVTSQSVSGLVFDTTTTSGYTLTGGTVTLGSNGITVNSTALATTISSNVITGTSQTIQNQSSNLLTIGGSVISAASTTQTLTIGGSGNINLNALLDDGASSTLNLTKSGSGYLRLGGAATNLNGGLNLQSGTLGVVNDFTATGLTGSGTFENATNADKWTFWTINSNQTFDGVIRNNNGINTGLLGFNKNGTGTLTLTNNANNVTSVLNVNSGRLVLNNTGTYGSTLQGGAVRTETTFIGNTAAANGVLDVNGATVNYNNRSASGTEVWRSTLNIGNNGTGAGALRMTSGSVATNKQLGIGMANGAYGAYVQSGGTTSIGSLSASNGAFLAVAVGGTNSRGLLHISGGSFNQNGPVTLGAGGIGVMNVSGTGSFSQTNTTADSGFWVGESGTGILNLTGGSFSQVATNSGVQLARNAGSTGIVNLNAGTLTTPRVYRGSGTGTFNFNGGTLKAAAANASFFTGLSSAVVQNGGGTIDNNGFAITVGQALLAPAGSGVTIGTISTSGSGYIAAPIVTITGGGGSGATAIATIDSSGNLTGITITNPGTGYTSVPTFTLSGGGIGNTGAITGSATLATNSSGSMTFTGNASGSTTLTGASTFSGDVTINGGTKVIANLANNNFNPTSSALGNNQVARSITLNGGSTLQFNSGDTLGGNTSTIATSIVVNAGSTVTNGGGVFNRLGSLTLNGGTLTSTSGAIAGYQAYSFSSGAIVTVGGSSASTISGGGSFSGIHLNSNTSFVVQNATGDSASDLNVSAPLLDRNLSEGGSGGLTKSGSGTMTLTATNTYSGATTISQGTLAIGIGGSIANSSTIQIASGATLDVTALNGWSLATGQSLTGTGSLNAGTSNTFTVGSGATLAPGNSPGTLTLTGSLSLASSSVFAVELSPTTLESDTVLVSGNLNIDPAATLALSLFGLDTTLADGTKFILVDYDGTWDGGTFSGFADNSITTLGLNSFYVDYNDASLGGSAFTLTAIPEPSTLLFSGLGMLGLASRRRRRA